MGLACPKPKPRLLDKRALKATTARQWREARLVVLKRDRHACRACGQSHGLEVHHVVLRSLGGKDVVSKQLHLCSSRCASRMYGLCASHLGFTSSTSY